MRIFITLIALVVTLVSCNPNPQVVYTQQVPIVQQPVAVQQQYVPSNQNYQVITDPYSGAQQVVYSMNGLQYVIAYATFMNWYNYGGYGYVNSMYRSSPSYFGSYNYNRYRGWRWCGALPKKWQVYPPPRVVHITTGSRHLSG